MRRPSLARSAAAASVPFALVAWLVAAAPAGPGPRTSAAPRAPREEAQERNAREQGRRPAGQTPRMLEREELEAQEGPDRADLRRDAARVWFGGDPGPEELDARNALAARELETWAHQIPGAPVGSRALPLPAGTATWRSLGPRTQNSNGGYGTDGVDVDSGRPTAILTHPTNAQIIYLATSGGGIFKCTNAALNGSATSWTWTPVSDSLPATSSSGNVSAGALGMGLADGTGNTIYAGMGDKFDAEGRGFFRSTNGGSTWTAASGIGNQTRSYDMLVLPQAAYPGATGDVIYWATNDGLKRSINGGSSFTNAATVGSGAAWTVKAMGGSTQNLVCSIQGGAGTGIYYSSDAGQTWTAATISGAVGTIGRITVSTTPASGTTAYAIYEDTGSGRIARGVLVSTDAGHTWTFRAPTNGNATGSGLFQTNVGGLSSDGGQGFYNHMLATSPADANTIFVAANLALYRSTDGGLTYGQMTHWYGGNRPYAHADFHAATWSQTGATALFVANDGGLTVFPDPFRASIPTTSLDTTFSDTRRNYGLPTHLIYNIGSTIATAHADDKYRVIAGLQDNGTRVRVGSGAALDTSVIYDEPLGGDGFGCHIHATDGNLMMGTSYYAVVYKSTDGGTNFSLSFNGNDTGIFYSKVAPGMADATGNTMYTFTSSAVQKSTNYGGSWAPLAASPGSGIRNVNTAKTNANVIGVTRNSGNATISTDGGATWTNYSASAFPNNLVNTFNYIWFDTNDANTVYVASAGAGITSNHLWKKVGAGAWTAIDSGTGFPTGIPVHVIQNDPQNSSILLAGTDFGVYRSTDGGATWARYGQGMPLVAVRDLYLAPDGSYVRAATFGRGVWQLDAGATLTVNITAPASPVTLVKGATQNYTANVTNFTSSSTVNWTVAAGGGSFSPASTTNGAPTTAFTAGTTAGTFAIKATAAEDGSGNTFANQNVTVVDPTSVTVTVSPSTSTVLAGATQAFSATVTPVTNTAVTWSISPAVGSINAGTGLYTAPATPPATTQTVTVTATSSAAPTRTGTATVTVPAVAVAISPTAPSVPVNGTQQFTATVTGSTNTAVTWSVQSGGGTVSGSGLYTAPGATGSAVVRATSVADNTKFAEATVTVTPLQVTVTVSPSSTTVAAGGTKQFTATVANAANTAVTWSVQEGAAGGTVNSSGLYSAPSTPGTYHVIATSVQDPTKSGSATVTVQPPVTITITPTEAWVQPNGTRTFTATASSGGVNYFVVQGSAGGSITSAGVYTAPATPGDYQVRASAQADGTKTATALVHVQPLVVTVLPAAATLQTGTTLQLSATVTGNPNTTVTWSVVEGAAGGSVDGSGLYTAPASPGTYHVRAASAVDPTKFAEATLTVQTAPVLTVTVAPATATLAFLATQTFTATVANGAPGVTWSVDEAGGGTVNAATGAYTAPAVAGVFHVRATSTADPTKSGLATVTVVSPVTTFTVAPTTATVLTGATVQLTGTVNVGTVNWAAPAGSLSATSGASVTFTAPATPGTVIVTATASADASKSLPVTIRVKTKDQDADGKVDVVDLALITRYYGTSNADADLNGDGIVDDADIAIFLNGF